MKQLGNEKLTANEVTFIILGIMLDVSVAGLPNDVSHISKQDGWISTGLGAIYPLYVAFIAIYISRKHPKENILVLSKRYLGNIIGTFFNILFFISLFSFFPATTSVLSIIGRIYVIPFLSPINIMAFLLIVSGYAAKKGIKVLGKICAVSFYLITGIIIVSAFVLGEGSLLNISPVFGSGTKNILLGVKASIYDYALLEVILLIYPFIEDSSQIKKAALKAVLYSFLIYTWITFISIYYLGTDILKKTTWAFFSVTEAVKLEVVNNFRYIFIFFWILLAFKSVTVMFYFSIQVLDSITRRKSEDFTYGIIGVIVVYIAYKYYPDRVTRRAIVEITSTYSIIFNLIYITLIAIIIFIKRDEENEKK